MGALALVIFAVLLAGLPLLTSLQVGNAVAFIPGLYQAGALVFGGGHVVLPLLKDVFVSHGAISTATFMAGYGAAQAMPGPLFSIAAFLGAAADGAMPVAGAVVATLALFAPAFLLVVGALPFWNTLRHVKPARNALAGVNAAVVGVLGAALYDPIFTTAIHGGQELALALVCYGLLKPARVPVWLIVIFAACAGTLLRL